MPSLVKSLRFQPILPGANLYLGEVLVTSLWLLGSVFWFYNRQDAKTQWSRAFSSVALVQFALLFFPVVRNSVWTWLLGVSFERAIRYHRWIGAAFFGACTVHGLLMTIEFGGQVLLSRSPHPPLYGFFGWVILCVMCLAATPCVRRRHFEVFYHTHFLFIVFIAVTTLHTKSLPFWGLPGLLLWAADRVVRFVRKKRLGQSVSVFAASVVHNVAVVSFKTNEVFHFEPGQYVFINAPHISRLQWHPFSVSSCPSQAPESLFTVHIKSMGPNTFSQQLVAAIQLSPNVLPKLVLDGPYGRLSTPILQYSTIVVFAGGIGVTPLLSVALAACSTTERSVSVSFIWSVRSRSMFQICAKDLRSLTRSLRCSVSLFVTSSVSTLNVKTSAPNSNSGLLAAEFPFSTGRPCPRDILTDIADICENDGDVAVLACGPDGMVRDVRLAARDCSIGKIAFHVHSETFLL